MSHIQATPTFGQNGVIGALPGEWVGLDLPLGASYPWVEAPVGSTYIYKPNETQGPRRFVKRQNNGRDDDWAAMAGLHCLQQYVTYSQFTDGGSTSGTLNLTETIPAGAWAFQVILENVTGFTGDVSAVVTVGDGTTVDRYMTGTPSIFTTAVAIDLGVPSGTKIHTVGKTVKLTVTTATDFTLVTAGNMTVRLYYLA